MSFGIAVRKRFAHGLSLESGVNYTLLRSDVRMQYTSDDVAQKLHFIGVPLRFNWQFLERGRFSLYVTCARQRASVGIAKVKTGLQQDP